MKSTKVSEKKQIDFSASLERGFQSMIQSPAK
jgi:hypothetical protein